MATLLVPQQGQNLDIDTAAEVLTTDTIMVRTATVIKALPGNSGIVYVGYTSGVTASTGWPLSASEEMCVAKAEVANAGAIYVVASTDNQGVAWRAV